MSARPTIRLLPKTDPRPFRRGAPWVFSNQLVMDRRTRAIPPGDLAVFEDAERGTIGLYAFNANSRIAARWIDNDAGAVVDRAWFERRLTRALQLRARLYDAPFYRLVHAEADGLPGVIIDRFGDTAVIQPNAAWADTRLDDLAEALAAVTGVSHVIKNASGRARALEGLDDQNAILAGAPQSLIEVPMNGAIYMADVLSGQKTGLFFDQRPNHAFAGRLAGGQDVLDVFCHVGGFGLAALANGALSALAVDGSARALELAVASATASGTADRLTTRRGDAFEVMEALGTEERRFGLVICDPPAFAPAKPALEAGLRAYERTARLAAGLVAPGGFLVLCSCSHAATLEAFRTASLRGIGRAGRSPQLIHTGFAGPDHPQHPHLAESAYLKALFFRLDG